MADFREWIAEYGVGTRVREEETTMKGTKQAKAAAKRKGTTVKYGKKK